MSDHFRLAHRSGTPGPPMRPHARRTPRKKPSMKRIVLFDLSSRAARGTARRSRKTPTGFSCLVPRPSTTPQDHVGPNRPAESFAIHVKIHRDLNHLLWQGACRAVQRTHASRNSRCVSMKRSCPRTERHGRSAPESALCCHLNRTPSPPRREARRPRSSGRAPADVNL